MLLAWVFKLGRRVLRYLRELLSLGDACLQGQGKNEKALEQEEKGKAKEGEAE